MMDQISHGPVIGIPVTNVSFASEAPPPAAMADVTGAAAADTLCDDCKHAADEKDSVGDWISRLRMKINRRVQGTRHADGKRMRKMSHAVKEKLRRYLQSGGAADRVFRKAFPPAVTEEEAEEEKVVKSSRCYLSTTAGPIAGTLFISTHRIAFLGDAPLKLTSHYDTIASFRYKVVIPLSRIKNAIPVQNLEMPNDKYIQILTVDEFDFWFMGFVDPEAFFNDLTKAISNRSLGVPIN